MTTETRRTLPEPNDPVREPIINSPFETPQWRWQLDTSTKAYAPALLGRRESQNIPPVAGSRKLRTTQALPGGMGARWIPLKLVNDIRTTVLGWQEDGYPGITQTSRDLINHWTDEEACQLYFAQLDAMLTHIYLNEAATNQIREEIQGINDQYNEGIHRIAHKMATATGKTPVMAMLILYHTANHRNAAPAAEEAVSAASTCSKTALPVLSESPVTLGSSLGFLWQEEERGLPVPKTGLVSP